jgi:hypothetical protein
MFEISSILLDVLTANLWNAGLQPHKKNQNWVNNEKVKTSTMFRIKGKKGEG